MLCDGRNPELVDRGALLLTLLAPIGRSIEQQARIRMIGGHALGRMRKEEVFRKFALVCWDGRKALDLLRVDDRQVQPRFRAVVQENRVDHLARAGWQPE